jgi:hypothetical protein
MRKGRRRQGDFRLTAAAQPARAFMEGCHSERATAREESGGTVLNQIPPAATASVGMTVMVGLYSP